jgi:hypothetical protein
MPWWNTPSVPSWMEGDSATTWKAQLALVKSRAARRITVHNAKVGVELCNHVYDTELRLGQGDTDRQDAAVQHAIRTACVSLKS